MKRMHTIRRHDAEDETTQRNGLASVVGIVNKHVIRCHGGVIELLRLGHVLRRSDIDFDIHLESLFRLAVVVAVAIAVAIRLLLLAAAGVMQRRRLSIFVLECVSVPSPTIVVISPRGPPTTQD